MGLWSEYGSYCLSSWYFDEATLKLLYKWGFPKIKVTLFGGPYDKDPNI